jgi:hypothetical protein
MSDSVTINAIEYIPKTPAPAGTRRVIVADNGFIYGGNVEQAEHMGMAGIIVRDAIGIRKWTTDATWSGVVNGPHPGVTLDRLGVDLFIPAHAVRGLHIVSDDWAAL